VKPEDFDYDLPPERVAQMPAPRREGARLLVHRRGADTTAHRRIADLPDCLRPGDLLVMNDTRVLPARLFGRRKSGARVEFLFSEPTAEPEVWTALCNPAGKLRPKEELLLAGGALRATLVRRPEDSTGRPGRQWWVRLEDIGDGTTDVPGMLERYGSVPLPPYIERDPAEKESAGDRERYQTVYARHPGAVAAPTAGLHLTQELLSTLEASGVECAFVTLHVGPGTFQPIQCRAIEDHRMHSERFEIAGETVDAIARTKERGGRVVCVGTTSVRVLESVAAEGELRAMEGRTSLYVYPGYEFRVCDAMLTNFHLPRSSLLVLVSAFAGRDRILRLYEEAIETGYRFYSYGDAMLLV